LRLQDHLLTGKLDQCVGSKRPDFLTAFKRAHPTVPVIIATGALDATTARKTSLKAMADRNLIDKRR
jgi:hypothetical protein